MSAAVTVPKLFMKGPIMTESDNAVIDAFAAMGRRAKEKPMTSDDVQNEIDECCHLLEDVEIRKLNFLRRCGWKHTCDTPGSLWLMEKLLPDGRTVLVGPDTALRMQVMLSPMPESADEDWEYDDYWEADEDVDHCRHCGAKYDGGNRCGACGNGDPLATGEFDPETGDGH